MKVCAIRNAGATDSSGTDIYRLISMIHIALIKGIYILADIDIENKHHLNVFMIGATGLLGSKASRQLLARGHEVRSLVLPGLPPTFSLPEGLSLSFGNYLDLSDDGLVAHFSGADVFVFAAGIDERIEVPAPAYDAFVRVNNEPLERLLRLAKAAGVKRAVICGSYFTYFNRVWPELSLASRHPYIKSRVEQENMALSFSSADFAVSVLGIPYVFGTQPGRRPVWTFLVELVRSMPFATFYAKGGTSALTARQIGEALAGAAEGKMTGAIPLGWFDLSWKEMFQLIHGAMGRPRRPFFSVPKPIFQIGARARMKRLAKRGVEGGLDLVSFSEFMYRDALIDRTLGAEPLGVSDDLLQAAVLASIRQSIEFLDGTVDGIAMRM